MKKIIDFMKFTYNKYEIIGLVVLIFLGVFLLVLSCNYPDTQQTFIENTTNIAAKIVNK